MAIVFKTNGLQFYPTDVSENPNGSSWDDLPYELQEQKYIVPLKCGRQLIDFTDSSVVQVAVSEGGSAPVVTVHNSGGSTLSTPSATLSQTVGGYDIYTFSINWNSLAIDNGGYVKINGSDGTYFKSEEVEDIAPSEFLKIVYRNYTAHFNYGTYVGCVDQILYVPGKLTDFKLPSSRAVYLSSDGSIQTLKHDHRQTKRIVSLATPFYLQEKIKFALSCDEVQIFQKAGGGLTVSDEYTLLDGQEYEIEQPVAKVAGYTGSCLVYKNNSFVRRASALGGTGGGSGLSVTLLNESSVTTSSFTANWQSLALADYYEAQISTDPTFSSGVTTFTNILTTSQAFTSLTACVKYYYRVRAVSCGITGSWSNNQTHQQISLHFRGAANALSFELDEKITNISVDNVFALSSGFTYKYANTTGVTDWTAYSYKTLTQIESDIAAGPTSYSLYVESTGYLGDTDEAFAVLDFVSETFFIYVGCLTYEIDATNVLSDDILIPFNQNVSFDSVTSSPSPAAIKYGLFTVGSDSFTSFTYNDTTSLNAAIALLSGEYVVGIAIETAATVTDYTLTINVSYI